MENFIVKLRMEHVRIILENVSTIFLALTKLYTEPRSVMQGATVGWSCCRSAGKIHPLGMPALTVVNEVAMKKDAPGCRQARKYQISKFPFLLRYGTKWRWKTTVKIF